MGYSGSCEGFSIEMMTFPFLKIFVSTFFDNVGDGWGGGYLMTARGMDQMSPGQERWHGSCPHAHCSYSLPRCQGIKRQWVIRIPWHFLRSYTQTLQPSREMNNPVHIAETIKQDTGDVRSAPGLHSYQNGPPGLLNTTISETK